MGLFFNNYNKPGPGVSRDEPKKKGIALYLTLYFRHFFDFIKMNFMYFVSCIPLIILLWFTTDYMISAFFGSILSSLDSIGIIQIKVWTILLYILFFGSGPCSMGFAYMCKCVTEEKHTFLFHDFKKKFVENLKSGLIILVLDFVLVCYVFPTALHVYYSMYAESKNTLYFVLLTVMTLIFIGYTLMHFYFYQFAVGYELRFIDLIKNSFLMSIMHFPMNLFFGIIILVITFLLTAYLLPISLIVVAVILLSLLHYPIDFYTSRKIAGIMIQNTDE